MRVLYLLNFAGKAGTERYVETLVRQLRDRGIEPFFAYHEEGLLVQRMQELHVPVFSLKMRSPFDFRAAKRLAELCRENQIELIHTHYLRENYIAMLAKHWGSGAKVVYTSHFIMKNNGVTRLTNRILSKKQDSVISVCTRGKEQLIKNGLPAHKIQVIFNAVDPEPWGEALDSTLKTELGIAAETFVMLCASRFAHDKGHKYLIDSIKLLTQMTQKPFRLVLAGDGELQPAAKEQVQQLGLEGCVDFIGFRKDIKNLFYGSDLYINASEHEALSFLIVEAMAAGLPVIATDMGGNRDIVNPENDCGLLVEYDNPQSMAEAMKTLIEDPARLSRYAGGAKQAVYDKFHVRKMADATFAVYQSTGEE